MDGVPRNVSPSGSSARQKQNSAASNELDNTNLSNRNRNIRGHDEAEEDNDTVTDEQDIYELSCPRVDCPEKIVMEYRIL